MKANTWIAKRYELVQSPLYKISSKRKLAELLKIDLVAIESAHLSELICQYRIFRDPKTTRFITEPVKELKVIHQRLLNLFARITPREYVHSATKKRSYRTNAEQHLDGVNVLKIDIKKFFPSVQFHYVHNFFINVMQCSPDVATILAKLCTVKTNKHGVHLPTGSCISPILSFLVNRELFDRINNMCRDKGCIFTLYVDDFTISGENASRALLSEIAGEIFKSGYGYHKIRTFQGTPAIVTGLVLNNGKLSLPNERQKKIREYEDALLHSIGPMREKVLASLVGQLAEAEQINPLYRRQRLALQEKHAAEWQRVVSQRALRAKKAASRRAAKSV